MNAGDGRDREEIGLYARIRDLEDSGGICLRISMAPHPEGVMVTLERRDRPHHPQVILGLCGAEILAGFLMAARLSMPHGMPDEIVEGSFPVRFHLDCDPSLRVTIDPDDGTLFFIDEPLWDRLYAELCLVTAHGRELARRTEASLH